MKQDKGNRDSVKKEIEKLIQPILDKYEKLDLQTSPIYIKLKNNLQNQSWVSSAQAVLNKIKNSNSIFYISKEITRNKNDQRVEEMFAEFDVATRLVNTKFFGNFSEVEYLPKSNYNRSPDFLAKNRSVITPVEVKLLSPQGLDEKKFFQKLIDKVNNQALYQLESYYQIQKFGSGIVFIWSHQPIGLQNITYNNLKTYFEKSVPKQKFNLTIICILSNLGLWDFYL
ncbi:hypothetical protein M1555_00825 [Patescibacteria group bacterium]|nr:hypothetical protein [Patescibacteria group bacterium]